VTKGPRRSDFPFPHNRGRNRAARHHTALGSLREALSCLEVAAAMGHSPKVDPALRSRFDHLLGTLVRLSVVHCDPRAAAPARPRS
jgi:hypothetical protein